MQVGFFFTTAQEITILKGFEAFPVCRCSVYFLLALLLVTRLMFFQRLRQHGCSNRDVWLCGGGSFWFQTTFWYVRSKWRWSVKRFIFIFGLHHGLPLILFLVCSQSGHIDQNELAVVSYVVFLLCHFVDFAHLSGVRGLISLHLDSEATWWAAYTRTADHTDCWSRSELSPHNITWKKTLNALGSDP